MFCVCATVNQKTESALNLPVNEKSQSLFCVIGCVKLIDVGFPRLASISMAAPPLRPRNSRRLFTLSRRAILSKASPGALSSVVPSNAKSVTSLTTATFEDEILNVKRVRKKALNTPAHAGPLPPPSSAARTAGHREKNCTLLNAPDNDHPRPAGRGMESPLYARTGPPRHEHAYDGWGSTEGSSLCKIFSRAPRRPKNESRVSDSPQMLRSQNSPEPGVRGVPSRKME